MFDFCNFNTTVITRNLSAICDERVFHQTVLRSALFMTHTKSQLPTLRNHRVTVIQSQICLKPIGPVLCVRVLVLENHVCLGTGIGRLTSARDVLNSLVELARLLRTHKPNSFFIGPHSQQLSVPRKATLTRMPRSSHLEVASLELLWAR